MQAIDFCGKSVKKPLPAFVTHAGKMVQNALKVAKPPEKLFEISEMQRGAHIFLPAGFIETGCLVLDLGALFMAHGAHALSSAA